MLNFYQFLYYQLLALTSPNFPIMFIDKKLTAKDKCRHISIQFSPNELLEWCGRVLPYLWVQSLFFVGYLLGSKA